MPFLFDPLDLTLTRPEYQYGIFDAFSCGQTWSRGPVLCRSGFGATAHACRVVGEDHVLAVSRGEEGTHGGAPAWLRLLGWAGYGSLRCVTSASLGQPPKPSIRHNLENQPSLQKLRGDIGNKDGYGI